ncbi:MAG: bifunctional chorismate mutase/prephenate dehydratase [Ruminococcaceae bacterium]|jgi:chorismate mutase/prephenate dehydratase|nr:bifunctional chorismate mutase/prephenate dehydratase [Oscillospiraceae bacterium]
MTMDLQQARDEIRAADEEMAKLFLRRMAAVSEVAAYKKEHGLPVFDAAQEERVLQGRAALIADDELRSYYVQFLRHTMDVSKQYQHRLMDGLRVAYSGVEGAFAHIAAQRIFPAAHSVPYASFEDAYNAVTDGACDVAVLPIENSYAGEVGQVVDLMFRGSLYVSGVYDLYITQNLLGTPDATIDGVRTVLSHPQALLQCKGYLDSHGFEAHAADNTAVAAQVVAEKGDKSLAAIASADTAKLYGLKILDHDVNESRANTTRFAVFTRAQGSPDEKREGGAFLLLFTVNDEAGGLAKAINVIAAHHFNMRVLRSRPMKNLPWHYYFYVEAEGDDTSQDGRDMLEALREVCPILKVAGHYSAAENTQQGGETI